MRVFVCSPFSPSNGKTIEENKELARLMCRRLVLAGHHPFAPHLYLPDLLDDNDEAERDLGMGSGMEFLKVCSAIVVPEGVEPTRGMKQEIALAKSLGIPVLPLNTEAPLGRRLVVVGLSPAKELTEPFSLECRSGQVVRSWFDGVANVSYSNLFAKPGQEAGAAPWEWSAAAAGVDSALGVCLVAVGVRVGKELAEKHGDDRVLTVPHPSGKNRTLNGVNPEDLKARVLESLRDKGWL